MSIRPRRSVLYLPASNARALEKSRTLDADCLILDLEDAVAPDAKDTARIQAVAAVKAGGFGRREVMIRVNALSSPWGQADLEAVVLAQPDVILLPKVSDARMLADVSAEIERRGSVPSLRIFAMIETPQALLNLHEIASAARSVAPRLAGFVMGTNDLAKDTGARIVAGRAPMLAWLSMSVAAARSYDLAIIDGVYTALKDAEGLRAECQQGRDLGMDGKTLIHPEQIGVANAVFAPSSEEVTQARTIINAFALPENQGKGAISVDGRMVERLHAQMAQRTLDLVAAIGGEV